MPASGRRSAPGGTDTTRCQVSPASSDRHTDPWSAVWISAYIRLLFEGAICTSILPTGGLGRPLAIVFLAAGFFAFNFTTFLDVALALGFVFALAFTFFAIVVSFRSSIDGTDYFLRSTLCGLRLPIRPLSLPAAGSITALTSVGLPESIASFTARFNSSGVVTLTPTPPNASAILS